MSDRQRKTAHSSDEPSLIRLNYQPDSLALMSALRHLPGAAFLDSGARAGDNARYDILTALPVMTLRLEHGVVRAGGPASGTTGSGLHPACIFTAVRQALEALAPPAALLRNSQPDLPFRGGAIGYFGYESNAPMHGIGFDEDEHPRAPPAEVPAAHIGIYQWAVIVDHHRRQSCLFALPDCPPETLEQVSGALGSGSDDAPVPLTLRGSFRANMTREQYRERLQRLAELIRAGDCYQANFAQCFHAHCRGEAFEAYTRLRRISHSPFSAFLQCGSTNLLGFSPERFIEIDGGRVSTQPIKGTRPRSRDPARDGELAAELLRSDKDRAENLMIVDLLRNDLGTLCETGSVHTRELFRLYSFSHVHHLVSTVTGRLPPGTSALELLRNCFPGGSITGAPKRRAMQIIHELEPHRRSVYCGSVVRVGFDGRLDSNISIRTLLHHDDQLWCWGGGGIVADSQWEQEHQECLDKISFIINSLQDKPDV